MLLCFHHTQWEVFFQIKFHMKFHSFHLGMKSRVNRNFFIPGRDFISVTCKRTLKLYKFYKKASVIESLLSKTLSPHTYNCTSNDTLTDVFLWIYPCENIASFHTSMHSQIFYKYMFLKFPQNSQGNACTRLSWFQRKCFLKNF